MEQEVMDFWREICITRASYSIGVGPEFETFLGPGIAQAKRVPFGPQKVALIVRKKQNKKIFWFCELSAHSS
jgi:hypothetical protein